MSLLGRSAWTERRQHELDRWRDKTQHQYEGWRDGLQESWDRWFNQGSGRDQDKAAGRISRR